MEIMKYASKSCIKCKVLDRILKTISLPCEVQTLYAEDDNEENFAKLGINLLPTLRIINEDKEEWLEGTISPNQITQALDRVQN